MFYSANGKFTKIKSNKKIIEGMTDVDPDSSHYHTHHHDELTNKDNELSTKITELEASNQALSTQLTTLQSDFVTMQSDLSTVQGDLTTVQSNYIGHNDTITIRYPGADFKRLEKDGNNARFLDGSRGNQQVLIIESCKSELSTGDNNQCVDVDINA